MQKKKISIIGTMGIPANYGGFETLTEHLTMYLNKQYDITVYCSAKAYTEKLEYHNNCKLEYINLKSNGIQSIPYDILSIYKSLKFADTILILGISGAISLPFLKLFNKKIKIITNLDGRECKRDKWNTPAKLFLKFSEMIAVKFSNIVVSDNKIIQEYVKKEYKKDSELIAYGADHVQKNILSDKLIEKYPFLNDKYAFKVCRIEPENNIELILQAMQEHQELNFVIVGNWDVSEYGKNLRNKYKDIKNIFILDPIYNQFILNQIRSNCYIYLHGHSAGGTNPSLVEAMALALPILAYGVDYNRETTSHKAIYFDNKNELVTKLKNLDEELLKAVSLDMIEVAKQEYTWQEISNKYSKLF